VTSRRDLLEWVAEALSELGGSAPVVEIAKVIWKKHEGDLRASGNLFYTWQYDMRWAAQQLQIDGRLLKGEPRFGHWSLVGAP
jgi:hypothetical protein